MVHRAINGLLHVAPITGAWIETHCAPKLCSFERVAPITGAWIETVNIGTPASAIMVAPITGAWIETVRSQQRIRQHDRRPHHGGVD